MDIKFDRLTKLRRNDIEQKLVNIIIDNDLYVPDDPVASLKKALDFYDLVVRYDIEGIIDEIEGVKAITILDTEVPDEETGNLEKKNVIYLHKCFFECKNKELRRQYENYTVAHEIIHLIRDEPDYSKPDELGPRERVLSELRELVANSPEEIDKKLTPEELADYFAAVFVCMPLENDTRKGTSSYSFLAKWAEAKGNLEMLAKYYKIPLEPLIKLAALQSYRNYKVHFFKWNLDQEKLEDFHVPESESYDLSPLDPSPNDSKFWQPGDDTAVGLCLKNNKSEEHTSDLLNPPYHCWAYLEENLANDSKVLVLGYPANDATNLTGNIKNPSLDLLFSLYKEE